MTKSIPKAQEFNLSNSKRLISIKRAIPEGFTMDLWAMPMYKDLIILMPSTMAKLIQSRLKENQC